MDKTLDKIYSRDDLREFLGIYVKSPLEIENDGDFNVLGSYFICIPSVPCLYEKSPDSLSLSNIPHKRSSAPSCSLFLKFFDRVVVDTYAYHKYFKSHCGEFE